MKKSILALLALATIASTAAFGACDNSSDSADGNVSQEQTGGETGGGNGNQGGEQEAEITGIEFQSGDFTYDGTEKRVTVNEKDFPAGVTVRYENNAKTDAGEYTATAILSGENYKTKTITKQWKIEKAEITGITVEAAQEAEADGEFHLPVFSGNLPKGVSAKWFYENQSLTGGVKTHGKYQIKLVLSGKNYKEKTYDISYTLKMSLKEAKAAAQKAIAAFKETPAPWGFLPDVFKAENKLLTDGQIAQFTPVDKDGKAVNAYEDFVNVSEIPQNYIGKQMNVVYGVLNKAETALSYVNKAQAGLAAVESAYVEFISKNPENYQRFEDTEGTLQYKIEINGGSYDLYVKIGVVSVRIFADMSNEDAPVYGARVQLTNTTALKYEMKGAEYLKIALVIQNTASTQIEFVKKDGNTAGYIYEYLYAADKKITATSALLTVTKDYTTVIGTKGDFIPASGGRNCEVYSNKTGNLVGTEVKETVDKKEYDTLWFNLRDLQGVTSVKKTDEANGVNADTIYINDYTESAINSMMVNANAFKLDTSRRFDIEFKTVYAWKENEKTDEDGNKTTEYEQVKFEIPMLFVQRKCLDTFEKDFSDKNGKRLGGVASVELKGSAEAQAAVAAGYTILLPEYEKMKDSVSHEAIIAYCGTEKKAENE